MTKAVKGVGEAAHKAQKHVGELSEYGEALGEFGGEPGEKLEGFFGKVKKPGPMLENPYGVGAVAAAAYVGVHGVVGADFGDVLVLGVNDSADAATGEASLKGGVAAST